MENNSKNPDVRFGGYNDDWIECELGDLFQIENGYAFKSNYFLKDSSRYIVLTPGNVKIGGRFQSDKVNYYNIEGEFPEKFIFEAGDIFITMTDLTPTGQTLGLPAIIPKDENIYLHNQRLGKLTHLEVNKHYIYQLLCSPRYQKKIFSTSSGTTVKHTSVDRILASKFYHPKQEEQTQIGIFFQNLDQLIHQHQQKLFKLKTLKMAMLDKMFPKKGASVPQIRFKGFTEEWKEKKLNQISSYHSSSLTVGDASEQGKYRLFDANKAIGWTAKNRQPCEYITIIKDGSGVGRLRLLPKNTSFIGTMGALHPKNINIQFLFYSLLNTDLTKHITGATIPHVYYSDYGEDIHLVPEDEEQQKIGDYFENIDSLIKNHKKQQTKLQHIKKACLAKMFV